MLPDYVRRSHQSDLSKTSKHWDIFLSHCRRQKDLTRMQKSLMGLWVFDIMLTLSTSSSLECRGYRIVNAHSSVGRWTHIFMNNDNPFMLNGVTIPVIQDQYHFWNHCFNEPEILHYIHAQDDISGIIHMVYSKAVIWHDGTAVCSGNQHKTHIGLAEYGQPFMDLKTLLEVLMVIYDLLKSESGNWRIWHVSHPCFGTVTWLLYLKHKVLHHNISPKNVMHVEKVCCVATLPSSDTTLTTSDQQKVCFIRHLLDPT